MVFDGSIRAGQAIQGVNALHSDNAVSLAALAAQKRRKNESLKKSSKSNGQKQHQGPTLEAIQLALVDTVPEQADETVFVNLDPTHEYLFDYDAETDKIHLIDVDTKSIILTLTPQEFASVADKLNNTAGTMTDRTI